MKKVGKIGLFIINALLLNCLFFNCYAESVTVTKENLNEALKNFESSKDNEGEYKINVSDDSIDVTANGEKYVINYDLTGNPKFTYEVPIEQGMSYKSYKEKTDNLILPMIGYIAVANVQGVEIKDASAYFMFSYLSNALSGSETSGKKYIIVDDSNGSTTDKDESNENIIYTSEFEQKVMEYVNNIYKDKIVISDTSDGINSYEFTTERKDVTDTSCKLVASLSVNLDFDFSKIKGYTDKINGADSDKDDAKEDNTKTDIDTDKSNTKNNQYEEKNNTSSNGKNTKTSDETISNTSLPKAGFKRITYSAIILSICLIIFFVIKLKNYKDIK